QDSGYHPLLCYDGHTHDLIQIQLRTGNVFSSDGTVDLLQPVLNEYRTEYKNIRLKLRGDGGFAIPAIYDQAEDNDLSYAIRLKQNAALVRLHTRQEAGGPGSSASTTGGPCTYSGWWLRRRTARGSGSPRSARGTRAGSPSTGPDA
ncbi:MAG: transposase, partial [Lachnospiraceae bacterium]|nr:transposase [Lachnospiraceae bacterium]